MSAEVLQWHMDLEHVGQVFRRVRRGRGLKASEMAAAMELSAASVSRFEAGTRCTPLVVERYLQALAAPATAGALSEMQVEFLRQAVEHSRAAALREQEIAPLSFHLIRRRGNAALDRLVGRLAHDDLPGSLVDILGFVHATNWQALHLCGVDTDRDFLGQWQAWHGVGRSIAPSSPLAGATVGENVPRWTNSLMHLAQRHLFTRPCNALVARLGQLLPGQFPDAWQAAISLLLPYTSLIDRRTCRLDGGTITVGFALAGEAAVEMTAGGPTTLSLHIWQPETDGAHLALQHLATDRRRGELFFAHEFDRGDFHINAWLAANQPRPGPRPRL